MKPQFAFKYRLTIPSVGSLIRRRLGRICPKTETVVVDDSSADALLTVARQFESNEVQVVTQRIKERRPHGTKHFH